jgi:hypothetical protein
MKAAILSASLVIAARAATFPAGLPPHDGKPGNTAKPVKVFILSGQSNVVGMGEIKPGRPGKVTIAVKGFLQFAAKNPIPPAGHLTVWIEEQKLPSLE